MWQENAIYNSNLFLAVITVLVGFIAYLLYRKQKKDYKRDAASIVLMEIRNAERVIERMKSQGVQISSSVEEILPTNHWVKYNYLFMKSLDKDELDLVNNFYNKCSVIDKALSQMSTSRQLEQKGGYIHQAIVQIAKEAISEADLQNKKKIFLAIIQKEGWSFRPNAPIDTIVKTLNSLDKITTSTAGSKLKRIAKLK